MASHRQLANSHSRGPSGLGRHSNSQGLHGMSHAGTDQGSRILSADHIDQQVNPSQPKTILSYLHDKITTFLMSEHAAELKQQIKIEGDLVTSFFDSIDSENDSIVYHFLEDMKKDIELIMLILQNSASEMIVFFTYLLLLLKKLTPSDQSFLNTAHMIKSLAREINDEQNQPSQSYQADFNKFFMAHLLRNYCSIITESAQKR